MMRHILIGAVWLAVLGGAAAPAAAQQEEQQAQPPQVDLEELGFMSGCWHGSFVQDSVEGTIEEHYTTPSLNFMLGTTRYMLGRETIQYELTVIRRDPNGTVALVPYPSGVMAPRAFMLTQMVEQMAVFENPANEFPKRIIYWLAPPDELHARADNGAGTDGTEWLLQRAACPPQQPEGGP